MPLITITADHFEQILSQYDIIVLDFWATWCGPCKTFSIIFEEVAAVYPHILFGRVNVEEQQEIAAAFQVRAVPQVVILRCNPQGEPVVVFSESGVMPKSALLDLIEQAKKLDKTQLMQ